jgi:hypothetical protein
MSRGFGEWVDSFDGLATTGSCFPLIFSSGASTCKLEIKEVIG